MSFEKIAELKARFLPVYLVLMIAMIVVTIALLLMYAATREVVYANLAMISALSIYPIYTGFNRLRKLKVSRFRYLKVLSCDNCGHSEEKEHEVGDYVLKVEGVCPRCGAPILISTIYSVRE